MPKNSHNQKSDKQKIQSLQKQVRKLKEQIKKQQKVINEVQLELERTQTQLKLQKEDGSGSDQTTMNDLSIIIEENKKLKERLSEERENNKNHRANIQIQETEIKTFDEKIEKLKANVLAQDALIEKLKRAGSDVDKFKEQQKKHGREIAEMKRKMQIEGDEANKKIQNLMLNIKQLNVANNKLHADIDFASKKFAALKKQLEGESSTGMELMIMKDKSTQSQINKYQIADQVFNPKYKYSGKIRKVGYFSAPFVLFLIAIQAYRVYNKRQQT